ncbi:MAG: PIN domain-containing protein [Deinococcus sp.]|nr:PIN domain-containing protein [Deinococcus sp.]
MRDPDLKPRLVDTSVWIRAERRRHEALRSRLKSLTVAGMVWICWPIRAELLIGVRTPDRWAALDEQLSALEQAPVTDSTWRCAAHLGHELTRRGQAVPLPDLVIAATALEQRLELWTVDGDFKRIAAVSSLTLDEFGARQDT